MKMYVDVRNPAVCDGKFELVIKNELDALELGFGAPHC